MRSISTATVFILGAVASVLAHCNTSEDSPDINDCLAVADQLALLGDRSCCQKNAVSLCTPMAHAGTCNGTLRSILHRYHDTN